MSEKTYGQICFEQMSPCEKWIEQPLYLKETHERVAQAVLDEYKKREELVERMRHLVSYAMVFA